MEINFVNVILENLNLPACPYANKRSQSRCCLDSVPLSPASPSTFSLSGFLVLSLPTCTSLIPLLDLQRDQVHETIAINPLSPTAETREVREVT